MSSTHCTDKRSTVSSDRHTALAETPLGTDGWLLTALDNLGSSVEFQVTQEVHQLLDSGLPHGPPPQQLPGDAHSLDSLHGLDLPQLGQVGDHIGSWKAREDSA